MKAQPTLKISFKQTQFLQELDPKVLNRAAARAAKIKRAYYLQRRKALRAEALRLKTQAAALARLQPLDEAAVEKERQRVLATIEPIARPEREVFETHVRGSNPRFFAPNFFSTGIVRDEGGASHYYLWSLSGSSRPTPTNDPRNGLMGVQLGASFPAGWSNLCTGLGNLYYSASAQQVPFSAVFRVYGGGLALSIGLGYARAWLSLGIEAWIDGPLRRVPAHYRFMHEFWSSVPSPWVIERPHWDYLMYATPTIWLTLLPGDIVFGEAVIEQAAVAGGFGAGANCNALVHVEPLTIGP